MAGSARWGAAVDLPAVDRAEVARVEVWALELELQRAHRAAGTDMVRRPTVVVSVTTVDDVTGWGECPALAQPTYTSEWAQGAYRTLVEVLVPGWRDGGPPVVGHPMASGALADAATDVALRAGSTSLAEALGVVGASVATRAIVSAADLGDLERTVAAHLDAGWRHIGCKVGPDWLLEPLGLLRRTWPNLSLSADGNGQLADLDAGVWRAVDSLGLDELEQPCAAGDWLGSARVAAGLDCPVVLDESILTPDDVATMAHLGAGAVVNIKPARLGGLARSMAVVHACRLEGIDTLVGGMLETAVGRAGGLCVAAKVSGTRPTHLGPSDQYWAQDLADGLTMDADGTIAVPGGRGIGITPLAERLEGLVVDRTTVSFGP